MALTPIFGINLESLPKEALSLIEALAQRAQEADRLEQENRLLREMLRLERRPQEREAQRGTSRALGA
jgi:hypothetical protein